MVIVRAPVRISFGGGGTDLEAYYAQFGGLVLSAAITHYCYVAADTPADGGIRIASADYQVWERFRPGIIPPVVEPLALPKAAFEAFAGRGIREQGVDLFLASEVPPGSGLGSSSAMAVALCTALAAYTGMRTNAETIADLACRLEIERLGMPIGKQDQYASAYGGLNMIEFTHAGVRIAPLRLPPDTVAALSSRLLLFSTGQTRDSAGILRQQRADSTSNAAVIESLHTIKALALEMRAALVAEDFDGFGHLLHQAWERKRRLSNKVSSEAIDGWYTAARAAGALGGKITGAGGGGFLLLYCPPVALREVREALAGMGLQEMSFDFDFTGATVLTHAADAPPLSGLWSKMMIPCSRPPSRPTPVARFPQWASGNHVILGGTHDDSR